MSVSPSVPAKTTKELVMEQKSWLYQPLGNHLKSKRADQRPQFSIVDAIRMHCSEVFLLNGKNNKLLEGKIMGNHQHSNDV